MPNFLSYLVLLSSVCASLTIGEGIVRLSMSYDANVSYLSIAGTEQQPPLYANLDQFLQSKKAHLIPYRKWLNYWNNSLGFNDREFRFYKPKRTKRIMALGDSFAYGLVPYPDNVLTRVEEQLLKKCPSEKIELYNFGIAATGVWDYRMLYELSKNHYKEDVVLAHIYLGNDPPDVFNNWIDVPRRSAAKQRIRLFVLTFLRNSLQLLSSVERPQELFLAGDQHKDEAGEIPHAAQPIPGTPRITDSDQPLIGPAYTADAFDQVLSLELGRYYRSTKNPEQAETLWNVFFSELRSLKQLSEKRKSKLLFVLYPSYVQVFPSHVDRLISRISEQAKRPDLSRSDFDLTLPSRRIAEFCKNERIPCFDLSAEITSAINRSAQPSYIGRDVHWNIHGNGIAANIEAAAIRPLLCKTSAD